MIAGGRQLHSIYAGCNIGDSRTQERERIVLLAKYTRRCVKEKEGSGGESIYIHDPSANLGSACHTTRHTSENYRYSLKEVT